MLQKKYIHFKCHGTFSRIDHFIAIKQVSINLRLLKSSIFTNHKRMKQDIKSQEETWKKHQDEATE